MSKNDPFGFDISAAKDKKRKTKGRRGMSGAFETSTRICEREGCNEPGQYRAPKNPRNLDDYFWFCKEHVREYNANWNYFQGQSEEEFQQFIDNATVWERPTKPFGKSAQEDKWARHGVSDPLEILGANGTAPEARWGVLPIPKLLYPETSTFPFTSAAFRGPSAEGGHYFLPRTFLGFQ